MSELPEESPKTVFQHTPLYIETISETVASDKLKSLDPETRMNLLDQYSRANVDHVFSGLFIMHNAFVSYKKILKVPVSKI